MEASPSTCWRRTSPERKSSLTSKPEVLRRLPRQLRGHVIPATSFCWKAGEGPTESPSVPGKVLKPPEITRVVVLPKASSSSGLYLGLVPLHEQLTSRAAGDPAASLTGVSTAAPTSSGDGPHWSPGPRDGAGTPALLDGSLRKTNRVRQRRREIQVLEGLRPGGVPEEAPPFPEALGYWGVRLGNGGVCLVLQLVAWRSLARQDWAQEPHLGLPNTPAGEAPSLEPVPGRYHPAPTMEVRQSFQVLRQAASRSLPSLLCLR